MKPLLTMLALTLTLVGYGKAQQPKHLQPTNEVEMDLLMVRMSESRALALIPRLRDRRQSAVATKEIIKSIGGGEVVLIGWPFLATKSENRAVMEQINEFRFATVFEPPGSSKVTETTAEETNVASAPGVPVDPATEPPVGPAPAKTTTTESVSEGTPTTFETRNVGVTFEVEPAIDPNGRTIHLNMVPQHVRLRGMRKIVFEGPEGKKVIVEQPEFVTHKLTTSISVEDGDYTLLGVFNVVDMPGQTELFILHTRIKRIEVPSSEAPPSAPAPVTLTPTGGQ